MDLTSYKQTFTPLFRPNNHLAGKWRESRHWGPTLQAPRLLNLPVSHVDLGARNSADNAVPLGLKHRPLRRPCTCSRLPSSSPSSPLLVMPGSGEATPPPPRHCEFSSSLILPDSPLFLQPRSLTTAFTVLSGFTLMPKLILMGRPLGCLLTFLSAQFLQVEYSSIRAVCSSGCPFLSPF